MARLPRAMARLCMDQCAKPEETGVSAMEWTKVDTEVIQPDQYDGNWDAPNAVHLKACHLSYLGNQCRNMSSAG